MSREARLLGIHPSFYAVLRALVERADEKGQGWHGCSAEELRCSIGAFVVLREAGLVFVHRDDDGPPTWITVTSPERDIKWLPTYDAIRAIRASLSPSNRF